MLKQLALIAGGILLYNALTKKGEASTLPDGTSSLNLESLIDNLLARASLILDPEVRQNIVSSIRYWIDAGLSELQIKQYIDNVIEAVNRTWGTGQNVVVLDPLETTGEWLSEEIAGNRGDNWSSMPVLVDGGGGLQDSTYINPSIYDPSPIMPSPSGAWSVFRSYGGDALPRLTL